MPYGSPSEQRVMRLGERRFLAWTRVDPHIEVDDDERRTAGRWTYENNVTHFSLSEDDGETWGEAWKGNFLGGGAPEVHKLNDGSFLCIYRDEDTERHGINVSHSKDEGRTWTFVGQLTGPSERSTKRVGTELGYPIALRVSNGQIFVVFYGPWRNGNADIVGVYLEDLT